VDEGAPVGLGLVGGDHLLDAALGSLARRPVVSVGRVHPAVAEGVEVLHLDVAGTLVGGR
jgi:hypothetical protein